MIVKKINWRNYQHGIMGRIEECILFRIGYNAMIPKGNPDNEPSYVICSHIPFIKNVILVGSLEEGKEIAEKALYFAIHKLLEGDGNEKSSQKPTPEENQEKTEEDASANEISDQKLRGKEPTKIPTKSDAELDADDRFTQE